MSSVARAGILLVKLLFCCIVFKEEAHMVVGNVCRLDDIEAGKEFDLNGCRCLKFTVPVYLFQSKVPVNAVALEVKGGNLKGSPLSLRADQIVTIVEE
jgi:hypothetical protein